MVRVGIRTNSRNKVRDGITPVINHKQKKTKSTRELTTPAIILKMLINADNLVLR